MLHTYDYIVIGAAGAAGAGAAGAAGAGVAGAIIASDMRDNRKIFVLFLEQGENQNCDPIVTDGVNSRVPSRSSEYTDTYLSKPTPGLNRLQVKVQNGKGLGGSTIHNLLLAVRSSPAFYRGLALTNPIWDYSNVLEKYK